MDNKAYNQVLSKWLKSVLKTSPKSLSYYVEAFTHRSYSNEHKLNYCYQRLEYLGDSILGYLTAEYLFHKYPNATEGELTIIRKKMVQSKGEILAAKKINLQNYILLGQGFKKNSDIDKIIEDCFESFLAAVYLDLGLEHVSKILNETLFWLEDNKILEEALDYKTLVQEALVKHNTKNALYHTIQQDKDTFVSTLQAGGIVYGKGIGHNKKSAETNAAKEAYQKLLIVTGEK